MKESIVDLNLTDSLTVRLQVTYSEPQTATLEREPIQGGIESVEVVGIVKGTLHEFGQWCFDVDPLEGYLIHLLKTAQRENANEI